MFWKAVAAAIFAAAAAAAVPAHAASLTHDARELHEWVVKTHDHEARPFAIVDKKAARIFVFDKHGHLRGQSSALLGQASGDDSAPDVGEHTQEGVVPLMERTTPAGRFVSQPGVNLTGERVIWVDWNAAFAIHRLRPGRSKPDRERRLASSDAADHRASWGCVVVPVHFFKDVVQRWLGAHPAVVYVMPENGDARELFNSL
jgi:hypothetical protein